MIGKLHGKLTYANVVATLALVFAMSGGAYAASRIIITSKSQIKASVRKSLEKPGPKGATGAQGPQGSQGAAGTIGTAGTNGTNGTAGTNGTSVTSIEKSTPFSGGKCADGGSEFTSASGKTFACNGETGFTEHLPQGKTETGVWSAEAPEGSSEHPQSQPGIGSISFSIPLEGPLDSAHVFYIAPGASAPTQCPGTVEAPVAEEGDLCVFGSFASLIPDVNGVIHDPQENPGKTFSETGAGKTGALVMFQSEGSPPEGGFAVGTWAVTAG